MTCKEAIETHLEQAEVLVWYGKPRQGILFRPSDILMIPLSTIMSGLTALGLYKMITAPSSLPFIFYFVGVVFLFVMYYTLFGRFIAESNLRKRTCYGITSKRIIIDYKSPYKTFRSFSTKIAIPDIPAQSFEIANLPKIELIKQGSASYGTITFGLPAAYTSSWGARGGGSAMIVETEFKEIEEYQRAYDLIVDIRSGRGSAEAITAANHTGP